MVIGVGGLGHAAIQILKATSATRVIAVDPRAGARDLAITSCTNPALAPGDDLVNQLREATRARGADVVLDFVGTDQPLATSAATFRQLGDLTILGLGGGTLPVPFFGVPYEASVQTTYWGTAMNSRRSWSWPPAIS